MTSFSAFKAYDIRGKVPSELNETMAYDIGRAYATEFSPKSVLIGFDIRETSVSLHNELAKGLQDSGVDVISIGLCGTEEVYFQTVNLKTDGGIMITASHNPIDYNGLKLVRKNAIPISQETGLLKIADIIRAESYIKSDKKGEFKTYTDKTAYIDFLSTRVDKKKLKPLKIVVNAGNGCAGIVSDLLESHLPFEFIKVHNEPDGTFPNGIPNPLLPECREDTRNAVLVHKADIGIAWDGDFDRCFFFDHTGRFIESYYIIGLIAQQLLLKHPNENVVIDPRLIWNSEDQVSNASGTCILSKSGHSFMKQVMRENNALCGGEMSAHYYFRDFAYCDSGMIPWLLLTELISTSGKSLADWVDERIKAFPCSGEINFKVSDSQKVIDNIVQYFAKENPKMDTLDGVSLEFSDWRFNLRTSNTEPLIRLNVETHGNQALLEEKVNFLKSMIQ